METALEKDRSLPPGAARFNQVIRCYGPRFGSWDPAPFHPPSYTGQMSGVEIIAGKVLADSAAAVGKQVAADRREMQQAVIAAAQESEHMTAAGDALAKRAAMNQVVKTGIVQTLYRPIVRMLRISSEYFDNGFHEDITGKLADVPENDRMAPKPNVAAPAMEGLALNLEEPDLKEMYLNLLVSASDRRTAVGAHPSFVDAIRQLTTEEARLLKNVLLPKKFIPIVRLKVSVAHPTSSNSYSILQENVLNRHVTDTTQVLELDHLPAYVDNWNRLGLIEVSYAHFLTDANSYDWVSLRPEYVRYTQQYQPEGRTMSFDKGILTPTPRGLLFAQAVGLSNSPLDTPANPNSTN